MGFIKKVTLSDVDSLQRISIKTFSDTFEKDNSPEDMQNYLSTAYSLSKLSNELENPNSQFYFIYCEDTIAGYLKLNIADAQTENIDTEGLEIERIYIDTLYKRKGLGNKLLEKSISIASSLNKKSIWLGVWEHNAPAITFYNTMGFRKVGQHSFFMGEDEQIDFIMKKELNQ